MIKNICVFAFLAFCFFRSSAQTGLEDVIVEIYYITDENDITDTAGNMTLAAGSVTYRIFVDMAPGYKLQAVYGNPDHQLKLATTTHFFNNMDRGGITANDVTVNRLFQNTVALDSWVAIGASCSTQLGVLKEEDTDGSMIGGQKSDGGSARIEGGILRNEDERMGLPLTSADGMIPGKPDKVHFFGIDLEEFRHAKTASAILTNNGAWSALNGISGPTSSNRILIAQLTTDGDLSFALNLQLVSEEGKMERYVAENPKDSEIFHPALTFPLVTPN